jgi:hypothetical protein
MKMKSSKAATEIGLGDGGLQRAAERRLARARRTVHQKDVGPTHVPPSLDQMGGAWDHRAERSEWLGEGRR